MTDSNLPQTRQVATWQDAEVLARDWLRYLGYPDAGVTAGGPDGGVDVAATGALAQVKFQAHQVGAPDLQRLYGARAEATHQRLLFFTGTSYSTKAEAYAAQTNMALFTYTLSGHVHPANFVARLMLESAASRRAPASVASQSMSSASYTTAQSSQSDGKDGGPAIGHPSQDVRDLSGGRQLPSARAMALIAALVLALPATLTVVGFGAATTPGAAHADTAKGLGIAGVLAYVFGLTGVAMATSGLRRRWRRPLGLIPVLVVSGPGVGFWTALTVYGSQKYSTATPWLVLAGMVVPLLVLGLIRPSPEPDAAQEASASRSRQG